MEEANIFLNGEEVISINEQSDNVLISHNTFKTEEFLNRLGQNIGHNKKEKWLNEGVPCKMLAPNQQWQTGKIKICLQFIPDKPESILDDIRLNHREE